MADPGRDEVARCLQDDMLELGEKAEAAHEGPFEQPADPDGAGKRQPPAWLPEARLLAKRCKQIAQAARRAMKKPSLLQQVDMINPYTAEVTSVPACSAVPSTIVCASFACHAAGTRSGPAGDLGHAAWRRGREGGRRRRAPGRGAGGSGCSQGGRAHGTWWKAWCASCSRCCDAA